MKFWTRYSTIALIVVIGALLPVLAALQYHWLGEISRFEQQHLRANLQSAARRFSIEFDAELANLYQALHVPTERLAEPAGRIASDYAKWAQSFPYPKLVKAVYWVEVFAETKPTIRQVDLDAGVFREVDWPADEESDWAPIPRIFTTTRVSLAGTLDGLQNIKPASRFKVTPYARGDVSKTLGFDRTADGTGGLDAKIGIGNGLTLDLTANTDFSEVEADVQRVNLTRFSLFFPEKRDFFLENSGVFRFGPPEDPRRRRFRRSFGLSGGSLAGGQSRGNDLLLFFSRRIGLASEGEPIPVIGGGRLTGRSGPYELGFLNIQTGKEPLISNGSNGSTGRTGRTGTTSRWPA